MHLYVLTRGKPLDTEKWANCWEAQYVPVHFKDVKHLPFEYKGSPDEIMKVKKQYEAIIKAGQPIGMQVICRPVQLYEFVIPKEARDTVLKTMFKENKNMTSPCPLPAKLMAKALKGKTIKPFDEKANGLPFKHCDNISIYPIAEKEDKEMDWGENL